MKTRVIQNDPRHAHRNQLDGSDVGAVVDASTRPREPAIALSSRPAS